MPKQKLDDFSKVLLATGLVNQMAHILNQLIRDYKLLMLNSPKNKKGADEMATDLVDHEKEFADVLVNLCAMLENTYNYLDERDILMPIDKRIYDRHMAILLQGKDDINE